MHIIDKQSKANLLHCRFYEDYNFSGVVGYIDCTHVAIFPPKIADGEQPEKYLC